MNPESQHIETFDEVASIPVPPLKKRCWFIDFIHSLVISKDSLSKRQKKENRHKSEEFYLRTAQELLINNTNDSFMIETSRKLLIQQRIMDDTKARRRLEKWARNTIVAYLVVVFLLVILNGISQIIWKDLFTSHGFISDTVMTVILSTTTVNIIGLGVIVLKGHFPNYNHDDKDSSVNITYS